MGDNAAPVATQADDAQVTIRLITRLPADLKVPETAVAVPASINRYGLSQIINALLQLQPHRPFDFLVNGTLLRSSLAQCVEALHLSAEDVVDIEYTLAVLPPKPRAALPHDDWYTLPSDLAARDTTPPSLPQGVVPRAPRRSARFRRIRRLLACMDERRRCPSKRNHWCP